VGAHEVWSLVGPLVLFFSRTCYFFLPVNGSATRSKSRGSNSREDLSAIQQGDSLSDPTGIDLGFSIALHQADDVRSAVNFSLQSCVGWTSLPSGVLRIDQELYVEKPAQQVGLSFASWVVGSCQPHVRV